MQMKEISYSSKIKNLEILIFLIIDFKNLSSNRKINNGYFAYLIEISHKISLITDEKITVYFDSEWNTFIKERVGSWLNMFNRKLCYEDKTSNVFTSSIEMKEEESSANTLESKDFGTDQKNENYVISLLKKFIYML